MSQTTYTSTENLVLETDWLQALFNEIGVGPNPSSQFMQDVELAKSLTSNASGEVNADDQTISKIRAIIGVSSFIKVLNRVYRRNSEWITDFVLELNKVDTPWNTTDIQSKARNMMWEFTVACNLSPFCHNITRHEPDIQSTFGHNLWGTACKVLYSRTVSQQLKQLARGAIQIEAAHVDYGCIAVDISPLLEHTKYLNLRKSGSVTYYKTYATHGEPLSMIHKDILDITADWKRNGLWRRLTTDTKTTADRPKTRLVVLHANTIFINNKMPHIVSHTHILRPRSVVGPEEDFMHAYYRARQELASHKVDLTCGIATSKV